MQLRRAVWDENPSVLRVLSLPLAQVAVIPCMHLRELRCRFSGNLCSYICEYVLGIYSLWLWETERESIEAELQISMVEKKWSI